MSDDDDTDDANVLVLDSLINDEDDKLTQKTSSHVSETHNDDCTNIHENLKKEKIVYKLCRK